MATLRTIWLIGVSNLCIALPVAAQTLSAGSEKPAVASASDDQSTGDIVITAQKRTERLQDVPVSVAVVSGETLRSQHITSVEDLPLVSPSLSFNNSANTRGQGLSVRGVGTLSFSDGVEPSVSTVIDGVVLGRQAMSVFDLIDVERVEILRGPQGTLFGKNSSAGVLNIVTARPSSTPGGLYSVSYGERGEAKLQGSVTGPIISDVVSVRLTAYYDRSDGFIHNVFNDENLNDQNQFGFRGKLLVTPSDSLDLLAIVDYAKIAEHCCAPTIRSALPTGSFFGQTFAKLIGVTPSSDNEAVSVNAPYILNQNSFGASLEANQRFSEFTLTSITAYRNFRVFDNNDADLTPINILDLNNASQRQSQVTQELRLSSPGGQRLEYVFGLFYFHQALTTQTQVAGTFGAVPSPLTLGSQINRGIKTDNLAGFGQASYHLSGRLSLIAGLRYTTEKLDAYFNRVQLPGTVGSAPAGIGGPPLAAPSLTSDEGKLSQHFGLRYEFNPSAMVYATYSRGFKGAALNLLNPLRQAQITGGTFVVPAEIPTSYEIGTRTSFLSGHLQFNLTGFSETFKGFQATAFDAISGINTLTSAGELRSRGVEAEAIVIPTSGLRLSSNVAYTDVVFTNFPNGPCYPGELLLAASACHAQGPTFVQDLRGQRLNNAPRWAFTIGAAYVTPTGYRDLRFFADVNLAYRSAVNFSLSQDPNTVQAAYAILNVDTGLETADGHLKISVFARNLTSEHYASSIFATSFQAGGAQALAGYSQFFTRGARRVVGLSFSGKF